jgi:proline iminopeptidase
MALVGGLGASSEPGERALLDVGDGQRVLVEQSGHAEGVPVVLLHGGPGSGGSPALRRSFDPTRWRIVAVDQRGCGGSRPHASDPRVGLTTNTTTHLLDDLDVIRDHLGIERWCVFGVSWGTTLGLAHAQRHPDRVRGLLLAGVTLGRRAEIDHLYRGGLAATFPDAWARFLAPLPEGDRADPVAGYHRLLEHTDAATRAAAALAWTAWDWATASTDPGPLAGRWADPAFQLARARICAHYFAHDLWLGDDQLLSGVDRLAALPGILVDGRADHQTPLAIARELHARWPGSELVVVEQAGHAVDDAGMQTAIAAAADRLADATAS